MQTISRKLEKDPRSERKGAREDRGEVNSVEMVERVNS